MIAVDWERLRAIRLAALAEAPAAFASALGTEAVWPPAEWQSWAARSGEGSGQATFVAERAGRWLAIATGAVHRERPGAILFSMWVDPAARRQGLGRRIVNAVIGWARDRDHPTLWLHVAHGNVAAERLYRSLGFEPADPTDDGQTEMRLDLVRPA